MEKTGMDKKQKKRLRRRRQEAFLRFFLSFVLVVAIHALLVGLMWMKMQRMPQEEDLDRGGLRIWCMSSEDKQLTAEARDFLALSEVVQEPIGKMRLASPSEYCGGNYSGGDFAAWERDKTASGVRLSWPQFTSVLDGFLPRSDSSLVWRAPVLLGMGPQMGLGAIHDLYLYDLNASWQLWARPHAGDGSPWQTVPRQIAKGGPVRVSKYEHRSWQSVEAPSLAADASGILASKELAPRSLEGLNQVWIEVLGSPRAGNRIHLRRSCGIKTLDDLAIRWVLERHRNLGHHHTDGIRVSGPGVQVEYRIEFGEPLT